MRSIVFGIVLSLLWAQLGAAETGRLAPVQPGARDKCPVCGMFVARYPDWVAEIRYPDGKTVFFDGVKDMYKYYFDIRTYDPGRSANEISAVFVTDYYTTELIDAHEAFFVVGSDVYGPMGRELIPFATRQGAEEFIRDHNGKHVLGFEEITPEVISTLD